MNWSVYFAFAGWLLVDRGRAPAVFVGLCVVWLAVAVVLSATPRPESAADPRRLPLTSAFATQVRTSFGALWRSLGDPGTRALKIVILVAGVAPVLAGIYIPLDLIGLVDDPARSAAYIAASSALGYVIGAVGLTGSVANALLVVAGMFGFSAVVWWWHRRRSA